MSTESKFTFYKLGYYLPTIILTSYSGLFGAMIGIVLNKEFNNFVLLSLIVTFLGFAIIISLCLHLKLEISLSELLSDKNNRDDLKSQYKFHKVFLYIIILLIGSILIIAPVFFSSHEAYEIYLICKPKYI